MKSLRKRTIRRPVRWLPAVLAALIVSGCVTVGPDYVKPDTPVSASWNTDLRGGLAASEPNPETLASWWTVLRDQKLTSLIQRAVADNLDLKKARARIREARARRGVAAADLFPSLQGGGSALWTRHGEDKGSGRSSDFYSASFDAGWELDIFGGVRRSVEAADANLQATQENLRDVLVSLVAEVALNYTELRTFQARLAVAEANIQAQEETYRLTQWRYQAGLSDELAVQQARYNLENTRSQLPNLRTGREEAMNRIAVLLGEQPGAVHQELGKPEPIPVTPLEVAVGVPADLLRRRPDVRRAERDLAAQTARVGVATADLYPRLTLNGAIAIQAPTMGGLSASGNSVLSGGPRVTWPIFQGGAIRQNIEIQSALQEQALIAYESVILTALEEVENSLVAFAEEQERRRSLSEAAQAAEAAVQLAEFKYRAGLTDFNNVLDAQRSVLSFQEQLAYSDGAVASNLIRLYKALGGGWSPLPAEENSSPSKGETK